MIIYDNLKKNLKRYVKKFNDRITIDDFILYIKNAFRFYVASNHQKERKHLST